MKIAIVDDHTLFSESLRNLLQSELPEYEVEIFIDPVLFYEKGLNAFLPDIIIADLLMKNMSGLELLDALKDTPGREHKVIMLSSVSDIYTVKDAFRKGANAYLSKDARKEELMEAISSISKDEQYVNKSLRDRLFRHIFEEDESEDVYRLTAREKEVLQKICKGFMPKEIASDMNLSLHTVQQYLKNIMKKFKVKRTTELVVFAIQKGIFNPKE